MELDLKKTRRQSGTPFGSLLNGEWFLADEYLWIKMHPYVAHDDPLCNATRLDSTDGTYSREFADDELVTPISVVAPIVYVED